MPEWIQQAGIATAVIFVVLKLTYEFIFKLLAWQQKRRNGGQFPAKLNRRSNSAGNPRGSGSLIVEKLIGIIDELKDLTESNRRIEDCVKETNQRTKEIRRTVEKD